MFYTIYKVYATILTTVHAIFISHFFGATRRIRDTLGIKAQVLLAHLLSISRDAGHLIKHEI